MDRKEFEERTREFALRSIKLAQALPTNRVADVLTRQFLRSATSIGSNYREACRASSKRHFVTTLEIAEREASETEYWLDLIRDAELIKATRIEGLREECGEIARMLTASARTAKRNAKSHSENAKSTGNQLK